MFCLPSSLSPVVCLSGSCRPFQCSSTSRPCHFRGAALKLGQAALSLKFPTDTVLSIPKWFSRPGQSLRKPEEPWSCHGNRQPRKARRTSRLNWLPGEGWGGGSGFGAWSQTGMCSAYRIAWRRRQVGVFEIRSERRVGRGQGHAAAAIHAFPGMLESELTPGPPVTIAPAPNPMCH